MCLGFTELGQEDQIRLIKQGSFEVVLTRYTPLFEIDGMFTPNFEMKVPLQHFKMMPMGAFFQEQYEFASLFNSVGLNDQETAMLTSLMIMCPGKI